MTIHILKEFPATIKILFNEKEVFCVSTTQSLADEISLNIDGFNALKFCIYPHETKKLLPYSFIIDFESKSCFETKFAKVFFLPENNVLIKPLQISILNEDFSANQIELSNSKLKKLSFLNDLKGRARVQIFDAKENSLEVEEEYFVYTNKENNSVPDDLLLLDFFQAILAKDFSSAQKIVGPPLSDNFNREIIEKFFGNYQQAKIVNFYTLPSVVLIYENEARVYCARISNNKIIDINEIN